MYVASVNTEPSEAWRKRLDDILEVLEVPWGDHSFIGTWYVRADGAIYVQSVCHGCGTEQMQECVDPDPAIDAHKLRQRVTGFISPSCEETRRLNLVADVMET